MPATVTARGPLKVVAVLDPAELLDVPVPDGKPRVMRAIRLPHGTVLADLAAKSVRRAIAMVREHGPEAVAAVVQGRLVGSEITEAGVMVQPKGPKPTDSREVRRTRMQQAIAAVAAHVDADPEARAFLEDWAGAPKDGV